MKFKITTIQFVIVIACLFAPSLLHAQPGFGGGSTDDGGDLPIDGGLSLLVAAGVGYGVKKLRKKQNQPSDSTHHPI